MAKVSGTTRTSTSSAPKGMSASFGGGKGVLSGNDFDKMKASQFEGKSFVGGGSYELSTKNGEFKMTVDTTNGWNDEYGAEGTYYEISMVKGTNYTGGEQISRGFIEADKVYRGSGGYASYGTGAKLQEAIDKISPYLKERAKKFMQNNR